ncbi:probable disease resistance protein At4g27220 [Nymphaea colorata]|uniref:AAA+ ATPase domain-containing protein n=1 Tax=Nymphaea colorata TaxID=210225 RepID=A0A5K0VLQ9_9MAGN|nr:probable disease resistance protein At4g27220 [Nymphaea colorata]
MILEIATCILQGCNLFCVLCSPQLKDIIQLKENKQRLDYQFEVLMYQKNKIISYVEGGKRDGKVPSEPVECALQRMEKLEREYGDILKKFEVRHCGNCKLLFELSRQIENTGGEMKTEREIGLKYTDGEGVLRDPPPPMVEVLPVPHVYGREEVINRIMNHLNNDDIRIIGVWGITGVGKTTLAKMVNNQLIGKETLVFYVDMEEEPGNKGIQDQIAKRLQMTFREHDNEVTRAAMLFNRLKEKKFLLILDDVHRKLDLDHVGVPNRSDQSMMSKVLLTTTDFEMCKTMLSDETVEVDPLPKPHAWCLFREKAGKVVESHEIQPLAKEVAGECEGLPLFLVLLGEIMRDVEEVGIWNNALRELRALRVTRVLSNWSVADVDKQFRLLRRNYDRITDRSTRLCFLYCCLFSRRYSVNVKRLVSYWRSEGLMEELNSKDSTDKGFQIIERFRNSCLLKARDSFSSVMMLGLVRDMALKMADEEGHQFFVRDEKTNPLRQWPPKGMIPQDIKRISLMGHQIQSLADQPQQVWSELSTLILQHNPLKSIIDGFFHGMPALQVLDLSHTEITTLPPSISTLVNAQALYLGDCRYLREMPPIGELRQLKLLDLNHTQIEELPQGLEELSQLKTLILSYTKRLTRIRRGLMPCLLAIEELDMHQSAYSWGLEGMAKLETATLEELSSLHKLEALYVNIQNPICLIPNEFGDQWRILWQFNFSIGGDIDLQRRHNRELHVINSDGLLPSESVKMVLRRTQSLVLFNCTGIMWISQVGGSFKDLKSLFVHGCDDVSSLMIRGDDVDQDGEWGALETLDLRNLANLQSIWMGRAPRGGSLRNLTHITISCCPKLRSLFPIGIFGKENRLKEIQVLGCASIVEVFQGEVMEARAVGDGEVEDEAGLPCLRRVILENLPRLTMVCKEEPFLPFLEEVRVKSCPLLTNLPIRELGEIQQIKGSKIWWEQLKWQNESIKTAMQRKFLDIGE